MITLQVTVPGLRDLLGRFAKWDSELAQLRREGARQSAVRMTEILRRHAPKRTGRFSSSLYSRVISHSEKLTQVAFYSSDQKAQWVIYPTKPHIIRARGKALRISSSSGIFFRKQVSHPGTRGSDFTSRAFREAGPEFVKDMNRVGVRAIIKLAGVRR